MGTDRAPSILFELTGSAHNLEMRRPRLKDLFSHNLARAALASNAWMFTGGTDSGVMKLMGRALHQFDPERESGAELIGIVPCKLLTRIGRKDAGVSSRESEAASL
eukprot:6979813-Prymnesium_polylepis.1